MMSSVANVPRCWSRLGAAALLAAFVALAVAAPHSTPPVGADGPSPPGQLSLDAIGPPETVRMTPGRPCVTARHDSPDTSPPRTNSTVFTVPSRLRSTTTVGAGRDAFVADGHKASNFGSDALLWAGDRLGFGAVRSLIWFEVAELDSDQAVVEAELKLHLYGAEPTWDEPRDVRVRRIKDSWEEDAVTWYSMPGHSDDDEDQIDVGNDEGWFEWDVTELVQRWRWPVRPWTDWHRDNYGLLLLGYEAEGASRGFHSRETDRGPELLIDHVTDSAAPLGTLNQIPLYHNVEDESVPGTAVIRLRWSAEDPEPATGVDHFVLAAQRNREQWWYSDPIRESTGGLFRGENGKRFGFRVQAVDVAGNREAETPAETQTLVDLTPPSSTVKSLPAYVGGAFLLSWAGNDGPVGDELFASGITDYTVHYSINGGSWGRLWRETTEASGTFEPRQGWKYAFQVTARDRAGNYEPLGGAEAQTHVDGLPPVTGFTSVVGIDRPTFTVEWHGNDPGGSGIVSFDVQVRRDLEPWQDWATGVPATQKSFTGEYSHTYGFRARARDRAGNSSVYPQRPQLNVGVVDRGILTHAAHFPLVP